MDPVFRSKESSQNLADERGYFGARVWLGNLEALLVALPDSGYRTVRHSRFSLTAH